MMAQQTLLPTPSTREPGEPIAYYQSRLVTFFLQWRILATYDDDQLAQCDVGACRAVVAFRGELQATDAIVVAQLSDLRHWIAATQRVRKLAASGYTHDYAGQLAALDAAQPDGYPERTPEHPFVPVPGQTGCARCGYARGHHPTGGSGGQLTPLVPPPSVDPHGPNGSAVQLTGPAAIPARYTAISPAIGARTRATSVAGPAAVEW